MATILTLILIKPQRTVGDLPMDTHADIDLDHDLLPIKEEMKQAGKPLVGRIYRRHDDHGTYATDRDNFNEPLFTLSTHQLAFMLSELPLLSEWDQSIMKFLSSLDPTIKVVPWWH